MNKMELVTRVAEIAEITKIDADKAISATFAAIEEALAAGDKVQLVGFGTFEVRDRAARSGRNPKTGDPIKIPETKVPAFKPGKALKEKVTG